MWKPAEKGSPLLPGASLSPFSPGPVPPAPPQTWPQSRREAGGDRGAPGRSRARPFAPGPSPFAGGPSHSALPAPDVTTREAGLGRRGPAAKRVEGGRAVPAQSFKTARRPRLAPLPVRRSSSQRSRQRRVSCGRAQGVGATSWGARDRVRPGSRDATPLLDREQPPELVTVTGGPRCHPCRRPAVCATLARAPEFHFATPGQLPTPFELKRAGKVWGGVRAPPLDSPDSHPGLLESREIPRSCEGPPGSVPSLAARAGLVCQTGPAGLPGLRTPLGSHRCSVAPPSGEERLLGGQEQWRSPEALLG